MNRQWLSSRWLRRSAAILSSLSILAAAAPAPRVEASQSKSILTARMSRWEGDPAQKRKGPPGFDIQFRLVGARFDGTFGMEGLPQTVPEGEAFDAQVKLTNIGTKGIKITSVVVTGQTDQIATELLVKQVEPKTSATVATLKVPAQTTTGASFLITVVLSNGDKHRATLTFTKAA